MKATVTPVHTLAHIENVASLASEVWREHYSSILSDKQIDYMLDKFQSVGAIGHQITEEGYRYFLLEKSEPVGYFAVKECDGKLFLSKYYILKRYRGEGCASEGFKFLEKMAADNNLASIWLTVNRENRTSIEIYLHKGYEIVKTQVADIGNGFVMDDYIMEKHIGRL